MSTAAVARWWKPVVLTCGLLKFGAQGDVESLASRKSEELLKFFESVSGSEKYMCVAVGVRVVFARIS